ncbi:hypothetical protein [Sphingobium aromaticiconvertens]|uniref:hypothetical protein n=1 Tax=Sphingobium aromaticiconvertens TaxID=365341 RepID=UPI0030195B8F
MASIRRFIRHDVPPAVASAWRHCPREQTEQGSLRLFITEERGFCIEGQGLRVAARPHLLCRGGSERSFDDLVSDLEDAQAQVAKVTGIFCGKSLGMKT